jgi:Spy/CpxP family protein refolding chaperone
MRRLVVAAIAAVFVSGIAGAALGQATTPKRDRRAAGGAHGILGAVRLVAIPVKLVAKPLELTAEQVSQIEAIQKAYHDDMKALRPAKGSPPDPTTREKRQALTMKAVEQIHAILTPAQKEKLKTILRELAGYQLAGIPPRVLPELKLTPEQKTSIEALIKDAVAKAEALKGPDRRQQMPAMREDLRAKVEGVLTPAQIKILEKARSAQKRARKLDSAPGGPPAAGATAK